MNICLCESSTCLLPDNLRRKYKVSAIVAPYLVNTIRTHKQTNTRESSFTNQNLLIRV